MWLPSRETGRREKEISDDNAITFCVYAKHLQNTHTHTLSLSLSPFTPPQSHSITGFGKRTDRHKLNVDVGGRQGSRRKGARDRRLDAWNRPIGRDACEW